MIEELLIFISLGIFSGLIAGMFGIGGGTLIVPVLVTCFIGLGFEEEIIIHMAIGTSMASIFLLAWHLQMPIWQKMQLISKLCGLL